jgi:hypothetical protein
VWEEGCLSFPGIHEEIERAAKVTVRALDLHGNTFELTAEGLLAVAVQHENDHLEGTLMVDRVSLLKRRLIDREMRKQQVQSARVVIFHARGDRAPSRVMSLRPRVVFFGTPSFAVPCLAALARGGRRGRRGLPSPTSPRGGATSSPRRP